MTTLKLNRKTLNNQPATVDGSKEPMLVTEAQLKRFAPILLKVAKKLINK